MEQTVGQQIKWNFKTNGSLEILDKSGNLIYREYSNGDWGKYEYDSQGKVIYWETSSGFCEKREWDSQGNELYYENSLGEIIDNRLKPSPELTLESIAEQVLKLSELVNQFVNQVNNSK